ncbi:DUF5050 domain-containing protein [Desulfatirhabdium butyrativorans]|uniref:DUF5050 domain-containing protein n=1 Tax=Desulfatirhabdium butyrativorans TaxID=340467 RepID=UPI000480D14D|nr:DUF5050 domain-containing protein [Desulfatirhabdium butyrativorans]
MKTNVLLSSCWVIVLAVFLGFSAVGLAGASQAVYDKIVFTRQQSMDDWDLWLMNRDGTGETKILDSSYRDTMPYFHPKGTQIVFARVYSQKPMSSDIFVVNPDGTGETNLTDVSGLKNPCNAPKFSWDGSKIAFDTQSDRGDLDIWIMNSDGTGHRAVLNSSTDDSTPAFSPDGKWLVFQRQLTMDPNPTSKICKVNIQDGTVVELTDGNHLDETPAFSADGKYIIFKRGFTEWDLFRMPADHNPADQTTLVNLTNQPTTAKGTAYYSWEGDKIVYYAATAGPDTAEIWIMNPDGSNPTQITHNNTADWDPCFSPAKATELPVLQVQPTQQNVAASAGTTSFQVSNGGSGTMQWNAAVTSGSSWLSVTAGSTGTDSGTILCQYLEDTSGSTRTGKIQVVSAGASGSPIEVSVSQSAATSSNSAGKIAFTRQANTSTWNIYVMDRDGKNEKQVTTTQLRDTNPSFNPQGSRIAFCRINATPPYASDIYLINPDGTDEKNLTSGSSVSGHAHNPKFSWDGRYVVFDATDNSGNSHIWKMNADGSKMTALTTGTTNDTSPCMSPDNQWVVFQRAVADMPNPKSVICKLNLSSGDTVNLTDGSDLDEVPHYSPDGQSIVFRRGFTTCDLFRMPSNHSPSDMSSIVNLTNTPSYADDRPQYTWEGDRIVYYASTGGADKAEIYIMDADGKNPTRLTNNYVADWDPTPSPNCRIVGSGSGLIQEQVSSDETVELLINSTNGHGDIPVYEWLVLTAEYGGSSLPVQLISDLGMVPIEQVLSELSSYTYTFCSGGVTIVGKLAMNQLGLQSADRFLYAYAYQTSAGNIVMDNVVVITIK